MKQEYGTQTIFPPKQLIFNAFKHVPFNNLKVVVVGQDPYIKDGEAMGLCFSIPKNVKCPPSLKNIYKVSLFHVHFSDLPLYKGFGEWYKGWLPYTEPYPWRPDNVGRLRSAVAECSAYSAQGVIELACQEGLGAIHWPRHPDHQQQERGRRILALGKICLRKG